MPQGAKNSFSAFGRLMSLILPGLTYLIVISFVDDCVVMGRNFPDHLANVKTVLQRFRDAKLLLNPKSANSFGTKFPSLNISFLAKV